MGETYLVAPSNQYKASFLKAIEDYGEAGESQYAGAYALAETDFDAFLVKIEKASKGIDLPIGWVRCSTFWLVDSKENVVGIIRIRHGLTGSLELDGGHIGYDVPPSQRGRGYGNRLLELGLERARALGLNRVLLTCEPSNLRSRKIIERLGGQLQDEAISPESGLALCRYWIDLM